MPEFPTLAHYDATMSRFREQIAELALHVDQLEDRWERRMTDVTSALSDLSAAEISVANELTALVAQVQTLQQQIASGDTTSAAATAASIESVVSQLNSAVQSAQSTLTPAPSGDATPTSAANGGDVTTPADPTEVGSADPAAPAS